MLLIPAASPGPVGFHGADRGGHDGRCEHPHADAPGQHCGQQSVVAAALFADRTRAQVLLALADGRALPASVLADEAGVSAQAAGTQLTRLLHGGLVTVEHSGRHRYYRLASDHVATILDALAVIGSHPAGPVAATRWPTDSLSAPLATHPYRLGPAAAEVFTRLGLSRDVLTEPPPRRRPLLRFCLDWSEQRHHLGGRLGRVAHHPDCLELDHPPGGAPSTSPKSVPTKLRTRLGIILQ